MFYVKFCFKLVFRVRESVILKTAISDITSKLFILGKFPVMDKKCFSRLIAWKARNRCLSPSIQSPILIEAIILSKSFPEDFHSIHILENMTSHFWRGIPEDSFGRTLQGNELQSINSTLFFPIFPFDPPENIGKPLVFRCSLGDQKGKLGKKC